MNVSTLRPTTIATAAVRFAIGPCSLGLVLVAVSERGIRAIMLGDDRDALARELRERLPDVTPTPADGELDAVVAAVAALIVAPHEGFSLPLDPHGTTFQQRVWQALREIPAGATASYSDVAERIGSPAAVRAVAQACGANPIAVAIPCHRVVGRNGALTGYRWGVERKRALLAREARA